MSAHRLRALFVHEARGRLDGLTQALLAIEAGIVGGSDRGGTDGAGRPGSELDPAVVDALDRVLRDTHSLKGSAAMVGFEAVGDIAHGMEEAVGSIRSGDAMATTDVIETLLADVDAMRRLIEAPAEDVPTTPAASDPTPAGPASSDERVDVAVERLDDIVRLSGNVRSGLVRLRTLLGGDPTDQGMDVLRDLERTGRVLQHEAAAARMVPISAVGTRLQRAVRDAARSRGIQVRWRVAGGQTEIDRTVIRGIEDALLHLVRNSVAHGIEPPAVRREAGKDAEGEVRLTAVASRGRVRLTVSDDGGGLDRRALLERARLRGLPVDDDDWTALVFRSGLSTAADVDHLAGRGVGMDVVAAAVRAVQGTVSIDTTPGRGTSVTLELPTTLAVTRCVVVACGEARYAVPADDVLIVLGAGVEVQAAGGRAVVRHEDTTAPLLQLSALVGRDPSPTGPTLIVTADGQAAALRVDDVIRQGEVTVQSRLPGTPVNDLVLGTAVAGDGSALVVLDPVGLVAAAGVATPSTSTPSTSTPGSAAAPDPAPAKHVLVVDDALAVRELQRSLLERAGYRVTTAEDGRQALGVIAADPPDLVVTDVEMPRMDGYALTEAIRHGTAAGTAVVMLTTLDEESDRHRGVDAGADAHLAKAAFTADRFLAVVAEQIGAP